MTRSTAPLILVTGATGYIGGRLVPRLLEAGFRVRCLVRDASRLQGRPWRDEVELIEGDVLRPDSLTAAMAGAEAAYYLVHNTFYAEVRGLRRWLVPVPVLTPKLSSY